MLYLLICWASQIDGAYQEKRYILKNVCRHRGMILVEEAGQLNGPITPIRLVYDLGALKATSLVAILTTRR